MVNLHRNASICRIKEWTLWLCLFCPQCSDALIEENYQITFDTKLAEKSKNSTALMIIMRKLSDYL